MFIAKFNQTSDEGTFEADKNGNMPFIGTVLAGKSEGTLINGTIFQREGLEPNALYACENTHEVYEGKTQVRVEIVSKVGVLEYLTLRTQLGAPKLVIGSTTPTDDVVIDEPTAAKDKKADVVLNEEEA